eukprot:TRINITY_DN102022_c0_g1_i1.p1 TRINITY_DN102022_c0_g1~~TRINITY_DN102022_c0_g1_i1.p1  ORF type:complete len:242 (-),score=30.94 TRINITY_DN102022_c0_g1_i1:110-835(-)
MPFGGDVVRGYMALTVGCRFQVIQKTLYKHEGAMYEIPAGMKGSVTGVDTSGDARVQWEVPAGSTGPNSKWLLTSSFPKVKVLDPEPIPSDFTVHLTKNTADERFGLAVDLPGQRCLLLKEVLDEGVIASHNEANAGNEDVLLRPGDLIVDINGFYGDAKKMLEQAATESTLAVAVKRPQRSATGSPNGAPSANGGEEPMLTTIMTSKGEETRKLSAHEVARVGPEADEMADEKRICHCSC